MDPGASATATADRPVLSHPTRRDPPNRAQTHARAGTDHDSESREHATEDSATLLARKRLAQAGCAHPGPGSRTLRSHADIRTDETRNDRARRTTRGAWLQCRRIEW